MAQWVEEQESGGYGKLSLCLSLPEQWLWLTDTWPSSERQQRGGNNEVEQLAPLLATGTSLESRGRFSDDNPEGRKWDRWVELWRFIQVLQRGIQNVARKFLRCK